MALADGKDFVFCHRTTYVGTAGIGIGCLVGTRRRLLAVPLSVEVAVWNRSVTRTTFSLGDEPLNDGIARVLTGAELTVDELEEFLATIAGKLDGAALADLATAKRVRVRAGWFSRGIYHSAKERGPGWTGYPLKGRELAQRWLRFYGNLPNFVP